MSETIAERVKRIVAAQMAIKEEDVAETARLQEDLAADSLDLVELSMALEENFGIELPDEEAEKIKTVADAVALVERVAGAART